MVPMDYLQAIYPKFVDSIAFGCIPPKSEIRVCRRCWGDSSRLSGSGKSGVSGVRGEGKQRASKPRSRIGLFFVLNTSFRAVQALISVDGLRLYCPPCTGRMDYFSLLHLPDIQSQKDMADCFSPFPSPKNCSMHPAAQTTENAQKVSTSDFPGLLFISLLSVLLLWIPLVILTNNARRSATDSASSFYEGSGAKPVAVALNAQTAPGPTFVRAHAVFSSDSLKMSQGRAVSEIAAQALAARQEPNKHPVLALRTIRNKVIEHELARRTVLHGNRSKRRSSIMYFDRQDTLGRGKSVSLASWLQAWRQRRTEPN
jgi:hypothetical protein